MLSAEKQLTTRASAIVLVIRFILEVWTNFCEPPVGRNNPPRSCQIPPQHQVEKLANKRGPQDTIVQLSFQNGAILFFVLSFDSSICHSDCEYLLFLFSDCRCTDLSSTARQHAHMHRRTCAASSEIQQSHAGKTKNVSYFLINQIFHCLRRDVSD